MNEKIDEQIASLNKKILEMHQIKDSDVTKYAISASKNNDFQNWIYYSSLIRILKLTNATYKDLRDIIFFMRQFPVHTIRAALYWAAIHIRDTARQPGLWNIVQAIRERLSDMNS